ncbi:MAG: TRAP transporter small permease [Synergistaceae bacterium]|nr:TRAP transporter small permease [Synergistaceae bacterium]
MKETVAGGLKPGERFLRRVVDVNAWYNRIEEYISIFFLLIMLFLMTYQVVARFVFSTGNTWSEELSRYTYIWFTLITVSLALLHNAHIKIEVAMAVFPKKWRPKLMGLGMLILIFYCVLIVVFGVTMVKRNIRMGNVSLGLQLPMYIVYSIVPFSHVLIIIRCVQRMIALFYLGDDIEEVDEAEEAVKAARKNLEKDAIYQTSRSVDPQ